MADQLVDAYQENEARANAEFRDKWIGPRLHLQYRRTREIKGVVSNEAEEGFTNGTCTKDKDWMMGLTRGDLMVAGGIGTGQPLGAPC